MGAILIVYIPIRQCARDLICDLMICDFLVHRILQVPSHYPASPHILLLSRNTSGSSKIRGDAGDKMRGNTRCPVETRSLTQNIYSQIKMKEFTQNIYSQMKMRELIQNIHSQMKMREF